MNLTKKHTCYNNEFFGRWAWLYDYEKYFFSPLHRYTARFLDLKSPKRILDVATGTGAQAYELAKLGHDVVGIDLSLKMLAQAKKKLSPSLKLGFKEADGTKLPFKNETFDIATISWGIHDMPYETGVKVLNEMKRVIKKNGKILIMDYMNPRKHIVAKFTHPLISLYETKNYKPFIERGLETYINNTDLKVVEETTYLGVWELILLEK